MKQNMNICGPSGHRYDIIVSQLRIRIGSLTSAKTYSILVLHLETEHGFSKNTMKKVPRMYNKNRPGNIINKFDRTGFISLFAMSLKFFFIMIPLKLE